MQDTWKIKSPGNIHISATIKGYITKSKFHEYGLKFIKYLKDNGLANQKNLLIVDRHESHLYNLPFYEAMTSNNIEVLTIPPHTSHLLQALDLVPSVSLDYIPEPAAGASTLEVMADVHQRFDDVDSGEVEVLTAPRKVFKRHCFKKMHV